MYYALLGIVFFATLAMMVREGLWNNVVNLICIILAGLISFGTFQPATRYLDTQLGGQYTYLLDFIVLWFIFTLAVIVLKLAAKSASPKRVLFLEQADNYGGMGIGAIAGIIMTSMVMASLHCAPLEYKLFDGRFVMGSTYAEVKSNVETTTAISRPDLLWLSIAENTLSSGSLGGADFSAAAYIHNYAEHRKTFGEITEYRVDRR